MRDLGGYETLDGRPTRWGTLVRADSVSNLPPTSQAALIDYGIRTVIDLRTTAEVLKEPNVFARSPVVSYVHHDMAGDVGELAATEGTRASALAIMYIDMFERRRPQIGEVLAALAAPSALPALYHCHGGQDRTGLITALLLAINAPLGPALFPTGISRPPIGSAPTRICRPVQPSFPGECIEKHFGEAATVVSCAEEQQPKWA